MNVLSRFCPVWAAAALLSAMMFVNSDVASAQDAPSDKVVATVNGEAITEADLALAAQDFRDTLMQLPPQERLTGLINGIIDIRLMARAAEVAGVEKDEEAARRLRFVRDRALRAEYLRANVFGAISDEAVKAKYDEETAAFVPGEEIRASHILVETEDEAKAIVAELDKGGDFAAIAKDKSIDLGSGANGGDLDFFARGRMVKPFEDAAFALEVGKYTSTPVKSDFGFHIIKVVDKRMTTAPTIEQRQDALREEIAKELFLAAVEKLRSAAEIELIAPEPAPETPSPDAPAENPPAAEPAPQ